MNRKTLPLIAVLLIASLFLLSGCTEGSTSVAVSKTILNVDGNSIKEIIKLGDLNDVDVTGVVAGQLLGFDGNYWIPTTGAVPPDTYVLYTDFPLVDANILNLDYSKLLNVPATILYEGNNVSLLFNDAGYITDANVVLYEGGITLPSVSGQSGKYLSNDGSDLAWYSVSSITDHNQLNYLNWSEAGHTFDTNLDLGSFSLLASCVRLSDGNVFCSKQDLTQDLSSYLLVTDGNAWYALKSDVNTWVNQLIAPYLLQSDANSFFAFKSDVNAWGDQRYYSITNPLGFAVGSDVNVWVNQLVSPYLLQTDANSFFVKQTDFNSYLVPQSCPEGQALRSLGASPVCVSVSGGSFTDTNTQTAGFTSVDGNWLIDFKADQNIIFDVNKKIKVKNTVAEIYYDGNNWWYDDGQ